MMVVVTAKLCKKIPTLAYHNNFFCLFVSVLHLDHFKTNIFKLFKVFLL